MVTVNQTEAKVYSYIRWSKPDQDFNDSERRQLEMTRAFAKREGLIFDETLRMTDKGLSGYHGTHRKKGALGRFLLRVEEGDIPAKSVLVIENADRLSREGIGTALRTTIFKLWDYDITIQTLSPEERYEPGCENDPKFIALLYYLGRAHDESKQKSRRIKDIREHNRNLALQQGKKTNGQHPAWLETIRDSDENIIGFKTIPEAVETIVLMFDLRLSGMGKLAIAQELNRMAKWTPPAKKSRRDKRSKSPVWRETYVQSVLQNKAVIGEHQLYKFDKDNKRIKVGETLKKYFPRIIKDNIFYTIQKQFELNRGKGGRHGKVRNLFTHIIHCGYCNSSQVFINGGSKKNNPCYLMCDKYRLKNGCSRNSVRYDEIEDIILRNCRRLNPAEILPNPDKQVKLCQLLRRRIQGYEAELQESEKQINNLMANLGKTQNPKMVERYEKDIERLEEKIIEIESHKTSDERELANADSSLQSIAKWQRNLITMMRSIKEKGGAELRMRLRMHLSELIEDIEIFGRGLKCKVKFGSIGTLFDEKKAKPIHNKELAKFADYITKRTQDSKQGRFVKIHFKSGTVVEFWPDKAIPYDLTFWVGKDGNIDWSYKGNAFRWLWDEFQADS